MLRNPIAFRPSDKSLKLSGQNLARTEVASPIKMNSRYTAERFSRVATKASKGIPARIEAIESHASIMSQRQADISRTID